jgi:hypothetical protein
MDELIAVLSIWAATATGLTEAPHPPKVRQFEQHHIAAMHNGRYDAPGSDDIVAIYVGMVDTIVLRDDWNIHDPVDVSALVHELVHHLQHHAGAEYHCPQQREGVAFKVQEEWLNMFGEDLNSAYGIDKFTLTLTTNCLY